MNKIIFINNEARRAPTATRAPSPQASETRAETTGLKLCTGKEGFFNSGLRIGPGRIAWSRDRAHSLTESAWDNLQNHGADMHVAGTERGGAQCSVLGEGSSCIYAG